MEAVEITEEQARRERKKARNARSNFVANASRVLGFGPIARSADSIVPAAAGHARMK
jgi:hypothetical protein